MIGSTIISLFFPFMYHFELATCELYLHVHHRCERDLPIYINDLLWRKVPSFDIIGEMKVRLRKSDEIYQIPIQYKIDLIITQHS